jgi:hypothetical protein
MKKKNKGPNIDPCGTPIVILLGFDITPFHPTLCSLLDKYDLNHETIFSHIPKDFNLWIKTL